MEVRSGSVVVESGTGSGSFSHSIARAIGKTGKLWTFDFHEARATQAMKEFEEHGLADIVTAQCRDVCNTGFGLDKVADAVFLDLPSPWLAISHAKDVLREDRPTRIACFSPCMEQVQRTLPELYNHGFNEVEMFELILRPIEVEEIEMIKPSEEQQSGQKRKPTETIPMAKHKADIKGHTSYLYFASLLPKPQ